MFLTIIVVENKEKSAEITHHGIFNDTIIIYLSADYYNKLTNIYSK